MIIPQYSNTRLTVCLQTVGLFPVIVFKGAGGGTRSVLYYYRVLSWSASYSHDYVFPSTFSGCHLYQLQCLVVIEDTIFNILGRQSSKL